MTRLRLLTVLRVAVAGTALSASVAGPALAAGTVTRNNADQRVTYTAVGTANVVVTDAPSGGGTALTLSEAGIGVGATHVNCTDNGDSVTCTFGPGAMSEVASSLSAGSDVFDAGATTLTRLSIQDNTGGNDRLVGGNLAVSPSGFPTGDLLSPGPGTDQVFGNDGNDQLSTGPGGAELLDGGPGDDDVINLGSDPVGDVLRGGSGRDFLWARSTAIPSENFTIDLAAGSQTETAGASAPDVVEGFEDVRTDDGNDVLLGTDGPNVIEAGLGNDRVDGRLGADLVFGEGGSDFLEARDGIADRVDGGPDADVCMLDHLDESAECELLQVATVTPFGAGLPADVDPIGCTLRGPPARPRARAVSRRGVSLTADCDEPGRVTARLTAALPRRAGVRVARAGDVELARRSATLGAGDNARMRLRVGRRLRPLVVRRAVLRIELRAIDTAGNRARALVRRLRLR